MRWHQWFAKGLVEPRPRRASRPSAQGRGRLRPRLEQFEDRTLLSSYSALTVSDLINDINAANKHGGTNTITLTAPTTSPYVLTAVDNTMDGANGLPVIKKGNTLTIVGNADTIDRSTASGTPAFRLFDVASGASLTLQNMTLQNGLAFGSGSSAEGGAIYNQGALVLSGVAVQGNTAQGSDGAFKGSGTAGPGSDAAGGGIWSNGTLTLESSTVVQNDLAVGGYGGGVRGDGTDGPGGNGSGGGLYAAGGTVSVTSTTFSGNEAQGGHGGSGGHGLGGNGGAASGGGLYVATGTVTLAGDTLQNNTAQGGMGGEPDTGVSGNGGAASGGGVDVATGTVTLTGDSLQNDTARGGERGLPGPFNDPGHGGNGLGGALDVAGGSVTLSSDTLEFNTAQGFGLGGGTGSGGGLMSQAAAYRFAAILWNTTPLRARIPARASAAVSSSVPRRRSTSTASPWPIPSTTPTARAPTGPRPISTARTLPRTAEP
jgi:hypothetical protein